VLSRLYFGPAFHVRLLSWKLWLCMCGCVHISPTSRSWIVCHAQLCFAGIGGYSFGTIILIVAGTAALIAASTPPKSYDAAVNGLQEDFIPRVYDINAVAAYYRRRPVQVAQRSAEVAAAFARFGTGLLLDLWQGGSYVYITTKFAQAISETGRFGQCNATLDGSRNMRAVGRQSLRLGLKEAT
jgi:hypothetical protein